MSKKSGSLTNVVKGNRDKASRPCGDRLLGHEVRVMLKRC